MYSLDKSIQSFAVANDFVQNMNKVCYSLGKSLQPFCLYGGSEHEKYGVYDFTKFNGFLDKNVTLEREIANMRRDAYKEYFMHLTNTSEVDRTLFIDYLLTISICYVEVPRQTNKNGFTQKTFDKFLATKNPAIMGAWMGMRPEEMQAKYSARIANSQMCLANGTLKMVKLLNSSKGNSISVPRLEFNTEEMNCVPLFMLYAFQKGLEASLNSDILKFTFLKDNDEVRELNTTLNQGILMQYYSDNAFVGKMLANTDIESQKQGGMYLSSKISRGYIRLPEVGSSIYDQTGVRAVNIARLLKVEKVDKVDTTFIHVDLNSCIDTFKESTAQLLSRGVGLISEVYTALTGEDCGNDQFTAVLNNIFKFVDTRSVLLGTGFLRDLHMFMVMNPQWYPNYTGVPMRSVSTPASYGVSELDF